MLGSPRLSPYMRRCSVSALQPVAEPIPPSATELLTAREVARRLKIGKSTVYLLCKRGELPHVTIHRSVRIPAAGLARWLDARVVDTHRPH
jgi:excisionase family DNA binding protein